MNKKIILLTCTMLFVLSFVFSCADRNPSGVTANKTPISTITTTGSITSTATITRTITITRTATATRTITPTSTITLTSTPSIKLEASILYYESSNAGIAGMVVRQNNVIRAATSVTLDDLSNAAGASTFTYNGSTYYLSNIQSNVGWGANHTYQFTVVVDGVTYQGQAVTPGGITMNVDGINAQWSYPGTSNTIGVYLDGGYATHSFEDTNPSSPYTIANPAVAYPSAGTYYFRTSLVNHVTGVFVGAQTGSSINFTVESIRTIVKP
jgi:hypothetical protein